MIVVDTNVLSEAMKASASAQVLAWLNEQVAESLYLTSVTVAEIEFGIAALPDGKRKEALALARHRVLDLFRGRVLAFDTDAALRYGELAARARAAGRGFQVTDGFIAAIAATRGYAVATRDTAPFIAAGVSVIDPWQATNPS